VALAALDQAGLWRLRCVACTGCKISMYQSSHKQPNMAANLAVLAYIQSWGEPLAPPAVVRCTTAAAVRSDTHAVYMQYSVMYASLCAVVLIQIFPSLQLDSNGSSPPLSGHCTI
jgi:hypothetical protein